MFNRPRAHIDIDAESKKTKAANTTMNIMSFLADSGSAIATGAAGYVAYGLKEGVRAIAHSVTDATGVLDVVNSMVKDNAMKLVDAVGLTAVSRETVKFYTNLYQVWNFLTPQQRTALITYSVLAEAGLGYGLYNMFNHTGDDNEKHMIANTIAFASSAEALVAGRYGTTMWANRNIEKGIVPATAEEKRLLVLPESTSDVAYETPRPRFSNMG